jgi:hypothetical protein
MKQIQKEIIIFYAKKQVFTPWLLFTDVRAFTVPGNKAVISKMVS